MGRGVGGRAVAVYHAVRMPLLAHFGPATRRLGDHDELLVAEPLSPPPLDEAREAVGYWRARRAALPWYRVADRREAREMAERWSVRLRAAERQRYGAFAWIAAAARLPFRRVLRTAWAVVLAWTVAVVAAFTSALGLWPDLDPGGDLLRLLGGG